MDNNFFSLYKASDWKSGQAYNLNLQDESIKIQDAERFVFEDRISIGEITAEASMKSIALGDDGIMYFIDENARICMYDRGSKIVGILSDKSYPTKNFCLSYGKGKIYVYSLDNSPYIDVIVAETGTVEECIKDLDGLSAGISALHADSTGFVYVLIAGGTLYCINRSLNIKDRYELYRLIGRGFVENVAEKILLKGFGGSDIYVYDPGMGEFIHVNLLSRKIDAFEFSGCMSIGIGRNYVLLAKEENGDSTIYKYNNGVDTPFEKLFYWEDKPDIIEFDGKNKIYLIDLDGKNLSVMRKEIGVSFNSFEKLYGGTYYAEIFDAINPETLWDKIYIDANLPPDCMYSASYCAFNDWEMTHEGRKILFTDYISGKYDMHEKENFMHERWQGEIFNFDKSLFSHAVGRYMLIRIKLWGNSENTPNIKKIRVYFNRDTYTRYLPEIYSEGKESFIDRFLSMAETLMLGIEEKIDNMSDNFDPDKASPEMMRWLCKWLDLEVDSTWSEEKVKNLIKAAPDLFKQRGTKGAISDILEIYLEVKPIIIEDFQLNEMRSTKGLKEVVNRLYAENHYGYTVIVKLDRDLKTEEKTAIKKILDSESPAYCTYRFIVLDHWMALDKHTYLGINSQIMNWSKLKLDGRSVLPYNAILTDKSVIPRAEEGNGI